jgi:hypothetical protein
VPRSGKTTEEDLTGSADSQSNFYFYTENSTRKSGYNTYRGWTQTEYQNKRYNINQKDGGREDDRGRDEGANFILGIKEQTIFKDESTGSCICLWKLAVAVATYVSICIVYRILPSFAF